jgi:hypothetical protein
MTAAAATLGMTAPTAVNNVVMCYDQTYQIDDQKEEREQKKARTGL